MNKILELIIYNNILIISLLSNNAYFSFSYMFYNSDYIYLILYITSRTLKRGGGRKQLRGSPNGGKLKWWTSNSRHSYNPMRRTTIIKLGDQPGHLFTFSWRRPSLVFVLCFISSSIKVWKSYTIATLSAHRLFLRFNF